MSADFEITGTNAAALFTLKVYRGDSMVLLAMNWKSGKPPDDFVGFAIQYKEPGGNRYFALKNRLAFPGVDGKVNPNMLSTLLSPIQKFRWVHFPRNAGLEGRFTYRASPVFMNAKDELSQGDAQQVAIELRRDTYPGQINLAFTRGYISSQVFVDTYGAKAIPKLLPASAARGLTFKPTYPDAEKALAWLGFEAREAILDVLDKAVADTAAQVRVVAYDLNQPEIVSRLVKLGARLKIIIDDSADHGKTGSAENAADTQLEQSAGKNNVKRQHMKNLQHNKLIVVDGPAAQLVVCGSTNFSWRGLYVQNNNAMVLKGAAPVAVFKTAFEQYWQGDPNVFGGSASTAWIPLGLPGIDGQVSFSPHAASNARLTAIGDDIATRTSSSLFYSLAFLYQTSGPIRDAITTVTKNSAKFVYGISDRKVGGGLDVQKPSGNVSPVYPAELGANLPEPFKSEPIGGGGIRMHHKFVVIDFDKPTARVYLGSYNFSHPADTQNGENLILFRDKRIAVSYLVEALRIFDHYHFRVAQKEAKKAKKRLVLARPPRKKGDKPWWAEYYADPRKIRDRELFA